jgi:AcrR family transcriptional regulator
MLNAAEELFAERGYHGTSVRQITERAAVNLAAINYHFKDKESLYRSVLSRRLRPLNQNRLDGLRRASEAGGCQPVSLVVALDCFARPLFELCGEPSSGGNHFARLLGRSMAEPLLFMDEFLAGEYHPVTLRFSHTIRRHVTGLSPEDFIWRLNFIVGAMHHSLATLHRMHALTRGICRDHDGQGALGCFVHLATAVLHAPPNSSQNSLLQPAS